MAKLTSIVGHFFHSFDPDTRHIVWQGQVLAQVGPGYYLVQLYEWLTGGAGVRRLVRIDDMLEWTLFDDEEEWRQVAATHLRANKT